jgi:putative ABC transport system ATP-binding protein
MSHEPVMELEGMTRSHRHADGGFTLEVQNLAIHPGEVAIFAGASGCGKSTLFDVLGLIARPDAARRFVFRLAGEREREMIQAQDKELAQLRGTMIGYVLQHGGLIPALTVADNISLPLRLRGSRVDCCHLNELAERLGIADQLRKKPAKLSGGQQQRAAIARALLPRPALLLADEPTGQLDGITAEGVRGLLVGTAREEGAALLVVTHDPALFQWDATRRFGFHLSKTMYGTVVSNLVEDLNLAPVPS